jgi:hypothetical protein
MDHMFIKCPFTKQVWAKIATVLNFKTTWDGPTLAGCFDYWTHREHKLKQLPSLVCSSIQLDINFKFFENGTPSTSFATYKTLGLLKNWIDIHSRKPILQITKRIPDLEDTPTG